MSNARLTKFARYCGFASVGMGFTTLLYFYIVRPDGFKGHNPVSYFATLPETKLVFMVGFSLAAVLFWVFIRYHLTSLLKIPLLIFAISTANFIALSVIPYDPSSSRSDFIHILLAQIFHITFVVGILITGLSNRSKSVKAAAYLVVAINAALVVPFISARGGSPLLLGLEITIGLSNVLWVLYMSHYGLSNPTSDST